MTIRIRVGSPPPTKYNQRLGTKLVTVSDQTDKTSLSSPHPGIHKEPEEGNKNKNENLK